VPHYLLTAGSEQSSNLRFIVFGEDAPGAVEALRRWLREELRITTLRGESMASNAITEGSIVVDEESIPPNWLAGKAIFKIDGRHLR
jgi:hypothetical protein